MFVREKRRIKIMQKIGKLLCIFILAFLVTSMTGAAATCNTAACKMDAKNDVFTFNSCKGTKCFNVLPNDIGAGKKVVTTGVIKTAKGGQVTMKSCGTFCYTKSVSCSKGTDSFTYKAINKFGQTDTAKVTLKFKCSGCSSCSSGSCSKCTSCK
jgi:hypothetical protein